LADSIRFACSNIYDTALDDVSLRGMGTTATLLLIASGRAFLAHVGDSRCYLLRGDTFVQLTEDHSLVNEQVQAGLMTEAEARTSHLKNIITRSVGFEPDVAVDTLVLPLQPGDRFLLCSDGLTNLVQDPELAKKLAQPSIEQVPAALVELANDRGGDDNITVICLEVLA
jgi:PPM family protein phosphatase